VVTKNPTDNYILANIQLVNLSRFKWQSRCTIREHWKAIWFLQMWETAVHDRGNIEQIYELDWQPMKS